MQIIGHQEKLFGIEVQTNPEEAKTMSLATTRGVNSKTENKY